MSLLQAGWERSVAVVDQPSHTAHEGRMHQVRRLLMDAAKHA